MRRKIKSVRDALAAQPSGNKFKAAADAVSVVLQVKEKPQPTPAETRRNRLFVDERGLELSAALDREQPLLAAAEADLWKKADADLARAVAPAAELAGMFATDASLDVARVSSLITKIQKELTEAKGALENIPTAGLKEYFASAGGDLTTIQKADLGIVSKPC